MIGGLMMAVGALYLTVARIERATMPSNGGATITALFGLVWVVVGLAVWVQA